MPRRFKITEAHMEAFSQQQRERFEHEMAAYVLQKHPKAVAELGDDGLCRLVRKGIQKARKYNIILEPDVARFIEFMVILAPDFDDHEEASWGRGILNNYSMTPESKLDTIGDGAVSPQERSSMRRTGTPGHQRTSGAGKIGDASRPCPGCAGADVPSGWMGASGRMSPV